MPINPDEVRKEWGNLSEKGKQEFLDSLSPEDVQTLTQALSAPREVELTGGRKGVVRQTSRGRETTIETDPIRQYKAFLEDPKAFLTNPFTTPEVTAGLFGSAQRTATIPAGIAQFGAELLDKYGPTEGAAQAVTGAVQDIPLIQATEQIRQEYPKSFRAGQIGTDIGIGLALPLPQKLRAMGGLKGVFGRSAFSTIPAAGMVATEFRPDSDFEQRMSDIGTTAATSFVAGPVMEGIGALRPKEFARRAVQKILNPRSARDIDDFSRLASAADEFTGAAKRIGVEPEEVGLISQITGSEKFSKLEAGVISAQPDRTKSELLRTLKRSFSALDSVLKKGGPRMSSEAVGRSVKSSYKRALTSAEALRSKNFNDIWEPNISRFGKAEIDGVTKNPREYLKAIDELIEEYGANTRVVNSLRKLKKTVSETNLEQIVKRRSVHSKASVGKGRPVGGMTDANESIYVNSRLSKALSDDLADVPGLKEANKAYARDSRVIESMNNTPIGKAFSAKTPKSLESYAKVFMSKSVDPSELKASYNMLSPRVKARVTRHVIDNAADNSVLSAGARESERISSTALREGEAAMDIADFVDNLPRGEKLDILFPNKIDKQEFVDIVRIMKSQADIAGHSGGARAIVSDAKDVAGVLVSQNPIFASRWASGPILNKVMHNILFTKEGRRRLLAAYVERGQTASARAIAVSQLAKYIQEDHNGNQVQQ